MNLYELSRIEHGYDGKPVLFIDHMEIKRGAIVGLAGPNGSGKSTLLKLLGFIEAPRRGLVSFNGRPAAIDDRGIRRRVTLLAQTSYLLKRSVFRNISYGLKVRGSQRDLKKAVHQALEWVGLAPSAYAKRPWYALSGGEARRVALAARLVLRPEVLLLDEPTTSVDDLSAVNMKEAAMRAHRQWGTTLIVSSHDLPWLRGISDDIRHLMRGRSVGAGHPTFIYGPWRPVGGNRVAKALTLDQSFLANGPPSGDENAVAALDAVALRLCYSKQSPPEDHHRLQGVVTRLSYQQKDRIVVCVAVGTVSFSICIDKQQLNSALNPGSLVGLLYKPAAVTWH